ncbi:unnamed protein product [Didymodactylos carnosus]|uniref:Integrase catalytic domain-containing protein n=1 Tax=Didymodactylos carnosus TaxID=1234261 RepID=A0A8S2YI65_9BILA|nr:unnamed protein product [Didymodactylos carnosus]
MKSIVEDYVKSCTQCQQFNISRQKKPGKLHPIPPPSGPFQLIGTDFTGPFDRTPNDNRYVLSITDYFTLWVTAIALPNPSAQATAEAIFKDYICRYGVPITILSDQGSHFRNKLIQALESKIGINHIFSSVYHPQSNGLVERFNATFVPQLAKLQDRQKNNWDEFLDAIVFSYNTGKHHTTSYSPFELQFGRKPRLPTDKPSSKLVLKKPNDYFEQLEKSIKIIHENARQNIIN